MTRLPFELFLALRYLIPKRRFLSVIALISLAGVVIGVWVLIVVIGVMSGFDHELRETLIGSQPHVTVESRALVQNGDELVKKALAIPGTKAASPYVMGPVLIEYAKRAATPIMKGIDLKRDAFRERIKSSMRSGALDLAGEKVIVGSALAANLGIYVGDKITVYSPRNFEKKGDEVYLPMDLTVTGIFETGIYDIDFACIFTSLTTAQDLYEMGSAVHGIDVMTADPVSGAQQVADALNKVLPPDQHAMTWAEKNKRFLGAVQVEKVMMFIILMFIILVASFGITSTTITVTVLKTREIGMLKAVGAQSASVMRVFLLQGFLLGIIGVGLGCAFGLLTLHYVNPLKDFLSNAFHLEVFPQDIYQFSHIPVLLTNGFLALICGCALTICTLSGLFPALRAARLEPVEALRYE